MAEKSTIARPYAVAAFGLAKEKNELAKWSDMLGFAAVVVTDEAMQDYINNPKIEQETLSRLMLEICGDQLNEVGKNFIKVLVANKRLNVLPEIAVLYNELRADAEKTVEAEVISAFPLTDAQQNSLIEGLKKRLGREVSLVSKVDENLLGGAIVRAGDLVIDGSASGQLSKLETMLLH
ncbi:MAG: F0F1 ATP synthase subunit delta [Thioalkalispiraceae bacterium]|jgi:F-type H+-transporting ATPase subunit delta